MCGSTAANSDVIGYWSASFYPVDLPNDRRGVGSVVMEISDRIEAEVSLRASEAKLLKAQELAKIGNWEINISDEFEIGSARATCSSSKRSPVSATR